MTRLDIAIAGCGPAGLSCALLLARAGHRVTLFDQLERPAPLGSGLMVQVTGLAVLGELGLDHAIRRRGARIERMVGRAVPSGRTVLDVSYAPLGAGYEGIAVHRATLFDVLYGAVLAAELPIETAITVAAIEPAADGRPTLVAAGGKRFGPFDLVVDALGARSPLTGAGAPELAFGALWASLPWPGAPFAERTLEQRYRRASVMVGVLPIGLRPGDPTPQCAFFWSMKPAGYGSWRERGLDAWKDEVRAIWPQTEPFLERLEGPDDLVLARYRHRTLRRPAGLRLVHVGDSAHATSPQLGQGANMALLDAYALTTALGKEKDVAAALQSYVRARRWHVRLYQTLSAVFTPFYQSDSLLLPMLRDHLVATGARLPLVPRLLAEIIAGTLGRPLERLGLDVGKVVRAGPLPETLSP